MIKLDSYITLVSVAHPSTHNLDTGPCSDGGPPVRCEWMLSRWYLLWELWRHRGWLATVAVFVVLIQEVFHAVCLHSGAGISCDFQDFPMLKVPPPRWTLYKKVAQKVAMLVFVESQLKCVSIIENFDENLYRIVDKVKVEFMTS